MISSPVKSVRSEADDTTPGPSSRPTNWTRRKARKGKAMIADEKRMEKPYRMKPRPWGNRHMEVKPHRG